MLKITSNALVALVRAEQDCFKELFEAVDITRRISEFIWQWVPDRRKLLKSRLCYRIRIQHNTLQSNHLISVHTNTCNKIRQALCKFVAPRSAPW